MIYIFPLDWTEITQYFLFVSINLINSFMKNFSGIVCSSKVDG